MKTVVINLVKKTGTFAENKDIAREIRLNKIAPALKVNKKIILDFERVDGATQSFIHALISEVIREFGDEALDNISYKDCNENVQKIISIVVEYMQLSK